MSSVQAGVRTREAGVGLVREGLVRDGRAEEVGGLPGNALLAYSVVGAAVRPGRRLAGELRRRRHPHGLLECAARVVGHAEALAHDLGSELAQGVCRALVVAREGGGAARAFLCGRSRPAVERTTSMRMTAKSSP